jgi:hypothetical protein
VPAVVVVVVVAVVVVVVSGGVVVVVGGTVVVVSGEGIVVVPVGAVVPGVEGTGGAVPPEDAAVVGDLGVVGAVRVVGVDPLDRGGRPATLDGCATVGIVAVVVDVVGAGRRPGNPCSAWVAVTPPSPRSIVSGRIASTRRAMPAPASAKSCRRSCVWTRSLSSAVSPFVSSGGTTAPSPSST